jgi:signal transduction histidine kinase/FixJ family two-component response regulator
MRLSPGVIVFPVLIALLTWLSMSAFNPEAELFDSALTELDHFATVENALYRDVFTARAGSLRNYDPLVLEMNALSRCLDRLRTVASVDRDTAAAVGQLAASVQRQEELVEQFKSVNALLQNSLSFFGRFSTDLTENRQSGPLTPAVSAAAAAMLHLTLDTSPLAARQVQDRLDDLAAQPLAGQDDSIRALLAHGRLLHDLLPATDGILKAMSALPRKQDQEQFRSMLLKRQKATRDTARQYRRLLYAASLLLVALLVGLVLQLRARARALQRRAGLEHLIAGISMRFINVLSENIGIEIQRALADLAHYIGSDRAYLVLSGPSPQSYVWSRPGIGFPSGWPDQAPLLAAEIGSAAEEVIHLPRIDRMPPGATRDRCFSLGLGGWSCVMNASADGTVITLGFDALGRACSVTGPGELSLLRMAVDTVAYAVERHAMEHERERLETRLQQARRMETVGALASGISHNFNNILGGILGHAEIAEERLLMGGQPSRNLEAIRRGAEQARDLVEQILAFGSRRDVRRRPVSTKALVADAASLLQASLPSRIELAIRLAPQAAFVSGEPVQLQQVILNLCNNAAQATERAGRVEVETEVHDVASPRALSHGEIAPGRYVRIAIRDTGRGIDKATLERIFEPFFTTRSAGNGLGLATVREIVREHGGAISVWSVPGMGSRFEVWLPCVAAVGSAPNDAAALPFGGGETVLLIANDRAQLLRDEETLAALGYEPIGFTGAAAAIAACRTTPERFDMLVVGHLGSTAAALELAAALHAEVPHLPIVLATPSADEIGASALLIAGIDDVVQWPIVAAEVAAALDHCLATKRLAAEAAANSRREAYATADLQ